MHLQTLTKKIYLNEGWKDNNYQGYSDSIIENSRVVRAISDLFINKNVDVVSMVTTYEVTLKPKELKKEVEDLKLNTDFWVDYATGKLDA